MKKAIALSALLSASLFSFAFAQSPTSTSCLNLSRNLAIGSKDSLTGGEVTKVQAFLQGTHLSVSPTGYYGNMTVAAVKSFQGAYGISQVGTVGPQTRAKMNELSCSGATVSASQAQDTLQVAQSNYEVKSAPLPSQSQGNGFTVSIPTGGQVLKNESSIPVITNIMWEQRGTPKDDIVYLDLYNANGTLVKSITPTGTPNTGSYGWRYDPTLENGTYKIVVRAASPSGQSAYFSIGNNNTQPVPSNPVPSGMPPFQNGFTTHDLGEIKAGDYKGNNFVFIPFTLTFTISTRTGKSAHISVVKAPGNRNMGTIKVHTYGPDSSSAVHGSHTYIPLGTLKPGSYKMQFVTNETNNVPLEVVYQYTGGSVDGPFVGDTNNSSVTPPPIASTTLSRDYIGTADIPCPWGETRIGPCKYQGKLMSEAYPVPSASGFQEMNSGSIPYYGQTNHQPLYLGGGKKYAIKFKGDATLASFPVIFGAGTVQALQVPIDMFVAISRTKGDFFNAAPGCVVTPASITNAWAGGAPHSAAKIEVVWKGGPYDQAAWVKNGTYCVLEPTGHYYVNVAGAVSGACSEYWDPNRAYLGWQNDCPTVITNTNGWMQTLSP